MTSHFIQRGEIWHVDLEPTKGNEQRGKRFCLVVSQAKFNRFNAVWIVPITSGGAFARTKGFAVSLEKENLKTKGVILCHQLRTIDLHARGGYCVEHATDEIMAEVLDIIASILE